MNLAGSLFLGHGACTGHMLDVTGPAPIPGLRV